MTGNRIRILLVDDGEEYQRIISQFIPEFTLVRVGKGEEGHWARDGYQALAFLSKHASDVDVILLDMKFDIPEDRLYPLDDIEDANQLRRFQGMAILQQLQQRFAHIPVVLLTAYEDLAPVELAGKLMEHSMAYILDGHDLDTLKVRVHAALSESSRETEEPGILWGANVAVKAIQRKLRVLARGSLPVILEGETGTGKSYLAERFIHINSGRTGPFVVLDLATVPENLIAAHLFGAVKGAYTGATETRKGVFEIANGGTLFIDEIQNAPLEVQKQLLLVLQDKKIRPVGAAREMVVDVKVIAASNESLDQAVQDGRFRADLYMRLSPATTIHIPPLRRRKSDLMFFATRFVEKAATEPTVKGMIAQIHDSLPRPAGEGLTLVIGRGSSDALAQLSVMIPPAAWKLLESHYWPGNMRELEMFMMNIVTFTLIDVTDALSRGIPVTTSRLQVDAGLVSRLLRETRISIVPPVAKSHRAEEVTDGDAFHVGIHPGRSLNEVAKTVESQYFLDLYERCAGDFAQMARFLLDDPEKARAVRLRFNQLGLKVRDIRNR